MEKGKSIKVEFLLPEAIIQHIQSFLSGKEAAQTSILSKSWYSSFLTRPNLDFDQRYFGSGLGNRGDEEGFWDFAKKTMQRYEELKLKIENLTLRMRGTSPDDVEHYSYSLAKELIVKSIKLGTTDLNFEIQFRNKAFALPNEVLGSETLTRLSLAGCRIDRVADGKVSCSRLKSLSLCSVYVEGDIIWDIISSCPLIEELSLSHCSCFVRVDNQIVVRMETSLLELSPFVEFGKHISGPVVNGRIKLNVFHKLKRLLLKKVRIDAMLFHDFSSRFPCLKDLSLHNCDCDKTIRISSTSLECMSLSHDVNLRAWLDVPSILKFTYISSTAIPSLSFGRSSGEWESDIYIHCMGYRLEKSWFLKLKKFLEKLSPSKVSLSLQMGTCQNVVYVEDINGLHRPVVEDLKLSFYKPRAAFMNGLFLTCRPNFITLTCWDKSRKGNSDLLGLLYKMLVQEAGQDCCIPNQNTYPLYDLKDVSVELFEENLAEWRPQPWKTLLDASTSLPNERKIRLRLRWGPEPAKFKRCEPPPDLCSTSG